MVDKIPFPGKWKRRPWSFLCQKIADLHGYQMKIESTVGEGTKVSVLW